jgi:23S rRNA pseudouridine1911/1915/1917 synthase
MATPEILFEDNHLIVVCKPAGMLSQGEHTGDENLVDWARAHVGRNYVGLVQRLDRNTSGVMVIAKRTKSAQRLTEALLSGELQRTYLAWVKGRLEREMRWQHHLLKDESKNLVRVVPETNPQGKLAVLFAKPLRQGAWKNIPLTLVEFVLETGRSHQIRVQAAHEGLPLLGDVKYSGGNDGFQRPALHSHRLSFPHPMSREVMSFEAKLPEELDF